MESNIEVLPVHDRMTTRYSNKSMLYDALDFSFHFSVPILKNFLLSILFKTSNSVTSFPLESVSDAEQNYLSNKWKPSYQYMTETQGMNCY